MSESGDRPAGPGQPGGQDGAEQVTVPERDEAQAARRMDWGDPADAPGAQADSERAAKPEPQPYAERMEAALREAGPLGGPADPYAEQRREAPTEEGPGTSLP
jgi:hypothetical protein